ncbi:MAG: FtsH protease activity modulator HflK [Acetobacteraceae bacterium]|nr:FtsH protease activity modulator HflK [Acetobacteraceae bacterium]
MPSTESGSNARLSAGDPTRGFTVVASDPWNDVPPRPQPRPERPKNPWGPPPNGAQQAPDFDAMVEKLKKSVEGIFAGGGGGGGRNGGFGGGGGGRGGQGGSMFGTLGPKWTGVAVGVVVLGWLGSGFYRVQPDEQGIVMRFGAYNRSAVSGLNYHLPWPVESVLRPAVTRINRVDIGYRSASVDSQGRGGDVAEESLMLTGDENIIDINAAVFWRIRDAKAFLFSTRHPDITIKSAAESVMREVIGRTPIQPALTDARAQIEAAVTKGVQAIVDQYGTGVEITQVQLQRVDPPAAVIESFRDVQRANTDADRMRNEAESYRNDIVPRARGDAARITAEADATRQANIVEATGQAQRFLSVLAAYQKAKDVTVQRLYIETMQDILTHTPTVIVDAGTQGVMPYLPLDRLGSGVTADQPAAAPASGTIPLPPLPSLSRGATP